MTKDQFREALKSAEWSQKQFAERMGFDAATVSRWASGKRPIPQHIEEYLRVVVAVAEVLK
jgi:transcriptional regulator with XRE-family HTH domain